MQKTHFYEFQGFYADLKQKRLWREGVVVSLTPKAFDTLIFLLKNRGEVVTKDRILDEVWPDTFVDESTLSQNIYTLRKALGKLQNGKQIIETIPRRGFLFNPDVREINDEEFVIIEKHSVSRIFVEEKEITDDQTDSRTNKGVFKENFPKPNDHWLTRNKAILLAGLLIIVFVGTFFVLRNLPAKSNLVESIFKEIRMSKITSSGDVHRIAISPDGKYLAYVEKKDDLQTLYLRQTNNANTIEIIQPSKDNFIGITFSPDNEYLYYAVYPERDEKLGFNVGVLYKIPILGGTRCDVAGDIDSSATFSPDGKKIAFVRNMFIDKKESLIIIKDLETNYETKLSSREMNERFTPDGVAWSPNGKFIAGVAISSKTPLKPFELTISNVENGEHTALLSESWNWIGQPVWLKDNSGIVFPAFGDQSNNLNDEIWLASFPEGKLRQITSGINGFIGMGISADSNSIITVKSEVIASFWKGDAQNPNNATRINQGINESAFSGLGMDFTADGRMLYSTAQNGNADIWMLDSEGKHPKQITSEPSLDYYPIASPDGRYIVYISNRSGYHNLWRMEINGNNPLQLTNTNHIYSPSISPDSKWIYFKLSVDPNSPSFLWKISIDGGEPIKLTEKPAFSPKVSPDGKYVACFFPNISTDSKPPKQLKLTVLSAQDGTVVKQFNAPIKDLDKPLIWTPDSKSIIFWRKEKGVANFWQQPLDSDTPKQQTNWETDEIFRMAYSKDGKQIAFERGNLINDIILIQDISNQSK